MPFIGMTGWFLRCDEPSDALLERYSQSFAGPLFM